jgi:hypothetical protein
MSCAERGEITECTADDRLVVWNPTEAPVEGSVWVVPGSLGAYSAEVAEPRPGAGASGKLALRLAPGESQEVRVRARLLPFFLASDRRSGLEVRHFFLARVLEAEYSLPIRFGGVDAAPGQGTPRHAHPVRVVIRYPARWTVQEQRTRWALQASAAPGESEAAWSGSSAAFVHFIFTVPLRPLVLGGPFIGAGASLEKDNRRFKMRLGYEVARPSWLIYSLSADTDFRRAAVVAPAVEAALPTFWYLSFAAGLGIPVRVYDSFDAGLRLQVSAHAPVVGAVATIDLFPGLLRDVPKSATYSVYGQLSF